MSESREESPDWLRSFQAPTHSLQTLSSNSSSSHNGTCSMEDRVRQKETSLGNGDDKEVNDEITSEKHAEPHAPKTSIWALSSDSESCPDTSLKREEKTFDIPVKEEEENAALIVREGKSPLKRTSKGKSPKKGFKVIDQTPEEEKDVDYNVKEKGNDGHEDVEEEAAEKHNKPCASTSTLPLVLSDKVQRTKALVECEGESIDLSGDMGAVGRIVIPDTPNGNHEMYLDLKGTVYKTTIVPSRTFCIVSFGQSEAKIEAIMNDFIQLKPQSNVYEAETMVEGTLDGFSFESEDEADKNTKPTSHQIDQNDGIEEQTNGKTKAKAVKSSGVGRKRGTTSGGKPQPPKKAIKKTLVSKKAKAKK